MERRTHDQPFMHDGCSDDSHSRNNFASGLAHTANSLHSGNVQFCDGLIHGLPGLDNMPPITAAGASSSVYGPTWNPGSTAEAGLTPFPTSFGGWTSYPTDDSGVGQFSPEPISSPGSASLSFLSSDDYFRSLSQPDSTSSVENGLFDTTRVRSHSEHFELMGGIGSVDFAGLAQAGHDLYADSIEQWTKPQPPPPPQAQEPKSYDPFGPGPLLHQQPAEVMNPSLSSQGFTTPVDNLPQPPQPATTPPQEICDVPPVRNKPSYSEVARNKPQEIKLKKKDSPVPTVVPLQEGSGSQCKPEGFPDYSGTKHKCYSRPRQSKPHKPKRRAMLEPTNIKPDSRYGLDTFEGPVPMKASLSDHLSVSSGSAPHSRKGSTCSETGSCCGIDDLDAIDMLKRSCSTEESTTVHDHANKNAHPWAEMKFVSRPKTSNMNVTQHCSKSERESKTTNEHTGKHYAAESKSNDMSSARSEDGKRKTEVPRGDGSESKRARGNEANMAGSSKNKPVSGKQPVFFDPRRIFGADVKEKSCQAKPSVNKSQSGADGAAYVSIPNNQQPSAAPHHQNQTQSTTSGASSKHRQTVEAENILNNDKPKTKQNSNINRSCYINNNLRDSSKKQTNADAQRDSSTHSNQNATESGPQPMQQASSSHHSGRTASQPKQRSGPGPMKGGARHRGNGIGRSTNNIPHKPHGRGPVPSRFDAPRGQAASSSSRQEIRREDGTQTSELKPEFPPRRRFGERKNLSKESSWEQQYLIGDLIIQLWKWMAWASQELGYVLWNITKLTISIGLALLLMLGQHSLSAFKSFWIVIEARFFTSTGGKGVPEESARKTRPVIGLKENIVLPATGDDAMKRLLAGKGKDPYSILGVKADASDEVIKKYYRKQAVLVHPDKNQTPGAEEAFKILGHAFDLIGEPEKRKLYDTQRLEAQEEEEAMHQFADLLSKLNERMQEAANLMRCENCGGKHRRVPTERPMYAARYCQRCDYCHPVREGDVWAESHMLGFLWNYYACMDNRVYDITEWASCQSERLKHIQANAHQIVYRIATNGSRHARQNTNRSNEADIEDLLNHLFHHGTAGAGGQPGTSDPAAESFGQYGRPSASSSWSQSSSSGASKKQRRKKKRH